ncbi:MAG: hypothetical protein ACRDJP_05695 [Actinomycetota bacterium]
MRSVLNLIPGLGCAVVMGGMMWLMARGNRQAGRDAAQNAQAAPSGQDAQLAELRAEVERLRAEVDAQEPDPAH